MLKTMSEAGPVVGVITRADLLRPMIDDVPASARARAKGGEPPPISLSGSLNLRGRMKARFPDRIVSVLKLAGALAERTGVAAYVVGGFVRDLLLERPNLDFDIVIEGDGLAFAKALG